MTYRSLCSENLFPPSLASRKSFMTTAYTPDDDNLDFDNKYGVGIPVECAELQRAYQHSGLTAADRSAATGASVGTVCIALAGIRYRDGQPRTAKPKDEVLAKLASVLGVSAHLLRVFRRERAAELMNETEFAAVDLETPAAIAGRRVLAKQILAVFSTEELETEVRRRSGDSA